jgi:hypothetical protein
LRTVKNLFFVLFAVCNDSRKEHNSKSLALAGLKKAIEGAAKALET